MTKEEMNNTKTTLLTDNEKFMKSVEMNDLGLLVYLMEKEMRLRCETQNE